MLLCLFFMAHSLLSSVRLSSIYSGVVPSTYSYPGCLSWLVFLQNDVFLVSGYKGNQNLVSFPWAWPSVPDQKTKQGAEYPGFSAAGEDAPTVMPAEKALHVVSVREVVHVKTKLREVWSRGRFLSHGFTGDPSSSVPDIQRCHRHGRISMKLGNILAGCPGKNQQT